MPRAEHFGRSAHPELLRLPRPEASPSVGGYCRLASAKQQRDGNSTSGDEHLEVQLDGPLAFPDYGFVLEDTGDAKRPYKVQELESGHIWWYDAHMLQSVADEEVPEQLQHPPPPDDGDYVTLVPHYKQFNDAGRGPLSLQRTESAFGMIILASGNRFRVRACHPSGERAEWWYDREAVRKVHISYVPEHLRQQLRPGWGDYCVLTSDHAEFGAAAEGPLEEGNLGVVVGVDHLTDAQGALTQPRYCVRACHNGLLHRYHEGAVHPVVLQLLHDEKIPPENMAARMDKIMVTLTLLEAPTGNCGLAREAARSCVSRVVPGCPTLSELTCQAVTPGRKYWLQATMFCKDDDLMLASFKPIKWDLYAPCGIAGEYRPLRPVDPTLCAPTQQQQVPDGYTDQHQQHLCPELLSLQACRAHTRHMQWGDSAGGTGSRAYEAWRRKSSGTEWAAGRLADAAGGPGPWYMPYEDQLLGVFEWDSAEAPLVVQPGGVTTVQFLWEVAFADMKPHAQCAAPLHLQTTTNIADITAALTDAATSSTNHQQQLPTVMFEHMTAARGPGQSGQLYGQATPPPGGNPATTRRASSSSSSSESDEDRGSDDGSNADGSECHQSDTGAEGNEVTRVEGEVGVEEQQQDRACVGGTYADSHSAVEQQLQQQLEEDRGLEEATEEGYVAVQAAGGGAAAAAAALASAFVAAAAARSDGKVELQQQEVDGSAESQDCCSATAHNSSSASQHEQQQALGAEGLMPPQLVTASSGDWSFPLLQQANSSVDFPDSSVTATAGPFSAPTTPLAGAPAASAAALAAAADGRGRRRSSSGGSSNASAPCSVSSSGGSSPSKVSRHRPRSLSCDGSRRSSRPGTLTGVAFASLSGSRASSPVAAAAGTAADVFGLAAAAESHIAAAADIRSAAAVSAAAVSEIVPAPDAEASGSSVQLASSSQCAVEPDTPAAVDASTTGRSAASSHSSSSGGDSSVAGDSHSDTLAARLSSSTRATALASSSSSSGAQPAAAQGPSKNSHSIGAPSTCAPPAAAAAAAAVVPEVRWPRSMPPVLPVLGRSSISSRDSTSGSERSARSSSTAPAVSSRTARPSSSSGSRQAGPAPSGSSSGARAGSSTSRRSSSSSSAPVSRQGSGTVRMPGSGSSTPASGSSRSATPRASVTPTAQQQQQQIPLGPGMTSISEVMSQLERQAESRQPFWQEGTEGAADLAAKAYDAAVEWHQAWRRPGKM